MATNKSLSHEIKSHPSSDDLVAFAFFFFVLVMIFRVLEDIFKEIVSI